MTANRRPHGSTAHRSAPATAVRTATATARPTSATAMRGSAPTQRRDGQSHHLQVLPQRPVRKGRAVGFGGMTSSLTDAAIVPITLTVNGRIGLTLYAPPWEDEDGEEWQGFLGDGAKILLYPGTRELADFIASGEENDLSDHPAWGYVQKLTPDELRPGGEDAYDLDAVYEWASGEPDPVHVSALANVVDMVGRDRRLLRRRRAAPTRRGHPVLCRTGRRRRQLPRQGRPTRMERARRHDRRLVGARHRLRRPLAVVAGRLLGERSRERDRLGPRRRRADRDPGSPMSPTSRCAASSPKTLRSKRAQRSSAAMTTVAVFTEVADLAHYCRTAKDHRLVKLEWWSELADVEDDAVFTPGLDANYDLRKPSGRGADLLRELIAFCHLDIDTSVLDGSSIDRDDWRDVLDEVVTSFDHDD